MIRVLGGPAIRPPGWKIASASPRQTLISISPRRSSPASTASSTGAIPARRTTSPYTPTGRCCRRTCRRHSTRSSRATVSRNSASVFIDYFLKLKRSEAGRFQRWLEDAGMPPGDEPTEWEQNEYFDFF